jgi:DNA-binding Lrp family transcriptional regulator
MDGLDQLLIKELQANGIEKSCVMASRLGIGDRTIRRRLSEMRKKGVFKPVLIPNRVLLGHRAWARIGIKTWPKSSTEVAKALMDHSSVYTVACTLGAFDFIIDVQLDTFEDLGHFVNAELTLIPGIKNVETMILMSPRKYYKYSWPEPKYNEKCKYCNNTIIRKNGVDGVDRKIIDVLTKDGLLSLPLLKSKLKLSELTLRKRINDMLKNEAFKIEVIPDPSISGYEVHATVGIIINQYSPHEIIDKIMNNLPVYLASTSLGRFNIILGVRFPNMELLTKFVNQELSKIPGVSYIESFVHTQLLKFYTIKLPSLLT